MNKNILSPLFPSTSGGSAVNAFFANSRRTRKFAFGAALLALPLASSSAAVLVTTSTTPYPGAGVMTVDNTDLLQTSSAAGVATNVTNLVWGTIGQLADGTAGNTNPDGPTSGSVLEYENGANNGLHDGYTFSVQYNLNLSSASNGYDITAINTYAAWPDVRASQTYGVYVSLVGNAAFTLLQDVNFVVNPFAGGNSKVALTDSSDTLATGVDSIRFDFYNADYAPTENNSTTWRELDVIGAATAVPEPTTAAFLAFALTTTIIMRRRRA